MAGQQSLSAPHTMLTFNLSESKCSPIMCPPHNFSSRTIPFSYPSNGGMGALPHPIGGTEKPVSPARAAGNHPARRHMLPPFCFFIGGMGALPPCLRKALDLKRPSLITSVCQALLALEHPLFIAIQLPVQALQCAVQLFDARDNLLALL